MNVAPARTRATRWGAFTARQRSCADSMSLNAMARPAAREPGPLVILLLCLTVAKADSIGFGVRRCTPVLRGVVVERQAAALIFGQRGGPGRRRRPVRAGGDDHAAPARSRCELVSCSC